MPVQVKSESKKVWKFIIEREIEAPARFQAIQTHRAVMAILQQQVPLLTCHFQNGEQFFRLYLDLFKALARRSQADYIARLISHLPSTGSFCGAVVWLCTYSEESALHDGNKHLAHHRWGGSRK